MSTVTSKIRNRVAHGLGLLKQWLEKQGIEDYTQLSEQEKQTYNEWEAILTREASLDDLKAFLQKQVALLSKELRDAVEKGEDRRALRLVARLDNYEAIVDMLDAPHKAREVLIAQITSLIATR